MGDKILAMYLEAPMQSWGAGSLFDERRTLPYPTRSGITGLIAAACGIDRGDVNGISRLNSLGMTILTLQGGVMLNDFHTVGGGFDKKVSPQSIVRTAQSGKPGNTVVTHREYLLEARFAALLSGAENFILEIAEALQNPLWGIWLGRKCCIPTTPVYQGMFDSEDEALTHLEKLSGLKATRTVREAESFAEGTDTLSDMPVDFSRREYLPRRVNIE